MTRFTTTGLPEDLAAGAVSGHVAAKVMEPASMTMYRWEPGAAQRREHAALPGPPFQIAADKAARLAGIRLAGRCRDPAGVLVHYGLARSWAPPYALVRRDWHTPRGAAAPGTGAAMSAVVDEVLTPLPGFGAPNRDCPLVTRVRGVLARLAFGAAVAAVTGTAWALRRRRP
jgi:hypothetical protein